jgi:hypothetical protein
MNRKVFVQIFVLTLTDAICTAIGMRLGVITEANPLLRDVMTASPILASMGVCLLVGALLYFLYLFRGRVKWLGPALYAVTAVKLAVLGMHFAWVSQIM